MRNNQDEIFHIPIHEMSQVAGLDELNRYRMFWRSVLNQVFLDAFSASQKKRNFKDKRLAKVFMRMKNKNFIMMCELAGCEPKVILQHFEMLEKNNYKLVKKGG